MMRGPVRLLAQGLRGNGGAVSWADIAELARVATASDGRMVDADRGSLSAAIKEIRGCS